MKTSQDIEIIFAPRHRISRVDVKVAAMRHGLIQRIPGQHMPCMVVFASTPAGNPVAIHPFSLS